MDSTNCMDGMGKQLPIFYQQVCHICSHGTCGGTKMNQIIRLYFILHDQF